MRRLCKKNGLFVTAALLLPLGCGPSAQAPASAPVQPAPSSQPVAARTPAPPPKPADPWAGATLIQPPPVAPGEPIEVGTVTRVTLPNGLEVVVVPRHGLPVVRYALSVEAGSLDEPLERRGLADFTAQMLQKGTHDMTADQIGARVESVGAELNSGAGDDSSTISCKSLTKDAPLCLSTLADVVLHPTFPASEMDEVRRRAVAGVRGIKDDPQALGEEFFDNALYGDADPRGLPPTEDSLSAITQANLIAFYVEHYAPNDSILAVSGDVDPAAVVKAAKAAFGGWARKTLAERVVKSPAPPAGIHVELIDKPDLTQAGVVIGTTGIAKGDPDYLPTLLMNYSLGGGQFSSRLMKVVRSKNGDTYGVSSHFEAGRYPGAFVIATKTRVEKTLETYDDILAQVEKMRQGGPTEAELDAAKGNIAGSYPVRLQSAGEIAGALVDAEIEHLPSDWVQQFPVRVSAVTLDQARAAAAAHLDPANLDVVLVGNAEKLAPLLDHAKIAYEKIDWDKPVSRAAREAAKRGVTPAQAKDGLALLTKAIAAAGGPKALRAIHDLTLSGAVDVTAGPQHLTGTATEYQTMDGASRQEMSIGPIQMLVVAGPEGAYVSQGGEEQVLKGDDLAEARAQARFSPLGVLLHGKDPGVMLRGLGQKGGLDVLEVDAPGVDPITFYLDPRTHLIAKLTANQQGHTATVALADYKPELGVQIARKLTLDMSGAVVTFTFDKVAVNTGVKAELFAMPKK